MLRETEIHSVLCKQYLMYLHNLATFRRNIVTLCAYSSLTEGGGVASIAVAKLAHLTEQVTKYLHIREEDHLRNHLSAVYLCLGHKI